MKLTQLDAKHPEYDGKHLECLNALYAGGRQFRNKITQFLPQNPQEPDQIYDLRKKEAHYRSYMSTIIDHYTSWLFSGGFVPKATERDTGKDAEVDSYYSKFIEDCDGKGTDFEDFVRERLRRTLVDRKSHCLLERPSNEGDEPADRLEYIQRGLDGVTLCPVDDIDIWDWETDDYGNLLWFSLHTLTQSRGSISEDRDIITEIWRVYDSRTVQEFVYKYKKGERSRDPNFEVPNATITVHGFDFVPLITIELPEGMWIADKIESAQIEHFRLSAALSWLTRRTCYAMPVFKLENKEEPIPTHGSGYYIAIGANDDFEWAAPPNTPFDTIGKQVENQREEIFRITHQMALGLSNNADTAGRSADSKEFDVDATRVMLTALGQYACIFIEAILDKISRARQENDIKWNIEGFNGFDVATLSQLISTAQQSKLLGIPSKTYHKLLHTKVALASVPDANDHDKASIRAEISDAADKMPTGTILDPQESLVDQQKANAELARAQAEQALRPPPAPIRN